MTLTGHSWADGVGEIYLADDGKKIVYRTHPGTYGRLLGAKPSVVEEVPIHHDSWQEEMLRLANEVEILHLELECCHQVVSDLENGRDDEFDEEVPYGFAPVED